MKNTIQWTSLCLLFWGAVTIFPNEALSGGRKAWNSLLSRENIESFLKTRGLPETLETPLKELPQDSYLVIAKRWTSNQSYDLRAAVRSLNQTEPLGSQFQYLESGFVRETISTPTLHSNAGLIDEVHVIRVGQEKQLQLGGIKYYTHNKKECFRCFLTNPDQARLETNWKKLQKRQAPLAISNIEILFKPDSRGPHFLQKKPKW